jgi:phosphoribosylformylglycinamidine cyclo-ligase
LTWGAEPLFFLDYFATGKLDPGQAKIVIGGIAEGCRQSNCALIGGETAEMPGMYEGQEYDLAGFTVGVVERDGMIDGNAILPGHRVLGLRSSGPHSNGYSLVRKVLEVSGADPSMPFDLPDGSSGSLGQALLAPTRIYVRQILNLLKSCRVDGIAHITGGGLTENIVRILPPGMGVDIDLSSWSPPPVFDWLARQGNIPQSEMLRTFNCGIGMTLLVAPGQLDPVRQHLESAGEEVLEIGVVTRMDSSQRVRYLGS